jgi:hypothetical protein
MVKPGNSFVVRGSDPVWTRGIRFGQSGNSLTLQENNRVEGIVIAKRSMKSIGTGEMIL